MEFILTILVSGPGQRSFRQLQDFAAEMFNNDPAISKTYTGESWTEEFMEYGCYCNKAMRGGGKPDPTIPDSHESLCLGLINIQFNMIFFSRRWLCQIGHIDKVSLGSNHFESG